MPLWSGVRADVTRQFGTEAASLFPERRPYALPMAPPAKRTRAFLDDVESGTPSGNANEGVKVVGFADMPGRIAASASALYAKNLVTLP